MANLVSNIDKNIQNESKYCSKDVGSSLYFDDMKSIERLEDIGNIFRYHFQNTDISNEFIKKLDEFKARGSFFNLVKINEFLYDKDFIDFLYVCKDFQKANNVFSIREEAFDKGFIDKTNTTIYSKDLKPSIELSLITNDFNLPVICKDGAKIYKNLSFINSRFLNSVSLKDNSLIVGLDLGYLIYKHRNENLNITIYEPDSDYIEFFKENILKKMDTTLNIEFISSFENLNICSFETIVLDNTMYFEYQFKNFMDLKLYKCIDKLQADTLPIILNKLKFDYRSIIYSGVDNFIDSMIENYKDFKGIECSIIPNEIDFAKMCEKYLDENHIYYDNYKKFQRDINKDEFILSILNN